jgi:poly(A) polymerase Pap1
LDNITAETNKNIVMEFVPATSVLSDMLRKVDKDGKAVAKENYFLMPRDVEKVVKSF